MVAPFIIELPRPLESVAIFTPPGGAASTAGAEHAKTTAEAHAAAQQALVDAKARLDKERENVALSCQALGAAAEAIQTLEAQAIADAESQVVDLALAIAQKVLMQEIEGGRCRIEPIVREALRHAPSRREITVRLHPDDFAQWQQATVADAAPTSHLKVVADATIRRAGCLVETAEGTVTATLDDRLTLVAEAIKPAS